MQVVSHPQLTSGFTYESPLAELPALTHCGEAVTTAGHAMEPHSHPGFEFMYVARGDYTWAVAGRPHRQHVGDVFVAFPGQRHATSPVKHAPCHQLWLGVHLEALGPHGSHLAARLRAGRVHVVRNIPEAETLIRGIVLQTVNSGAHREAVAGAYLTTLVLLLSQRLSVADHPTETTEPGARRYSYPVLKALRLMEENLAQRLTLDQLARAAGIGVSQLCRRFRDEVGHTPVEHHRRLRLDAAKERLLAPDASITAVASSCGFSSAQHLTSLFQEHYGATPRQWQVLTAKQQ